MSAYFPNRNVRFVTSSIAEMGLGCYIDKQLAYGVLVLPDETRMFILDWLHAGDEF